MRRIKKKKVNQQGTLLKGSSETIRAINLNAGPSIKFINWFIGFVEGHENVFIVNRRYLRFDISTPIKNSKIIYYIKKILGFGEIRKLKFLDTIIIEYSVQDNVYHLIQLINIFNGSLRCSLKEENFQKWYYKLHVKLKKLNLLKLLPDYKKETKKISFMILDF